MRDHELKRQEPPKIWDNTLRTTFVECPRKMYYFLRRFTYPQAEIPIYFTWGRAWHEGLRVWHTTTHLSPEIREAKALLAARNLWRDEGGLDAKPLNTLDNLTEKLELYFDHWGPQEDWKIVPQGDEVGWIWPLNSQLELAGSMDSYVNWPNRGLFVLENKTTTEYLIPRFRQSFHFSTQITGYVWYLHQLLPKEDVFGALVNMVTKNRKGPRSKWKYPEFDRDHIRKLPHDLDQFEEDILADYEDFLRCWNDWRWPRRGMARLYTCSGGPGKSPCLFRGICSTPLKPEEVDPRRFVGIIETEKEWKPWEREGDV